MEQKSFKEVWGMSNETYDRLYNVVTMILPIVLTIVLGLETILGIEWLGTAGAILSLVLSAVGVRVNVSNRAYFEVHEVQIKPEYLREEYK